MEYGSWFSAGNGSSWWHAALCLVCIKDAPTSPGVESGVCERSRNASAGSGYEPYAPPIYRGPTYHRNIRILQTISGILFV